jgi:hypothetical protein
MRARECATNVAIILSIMAIGALLRRTDVHGGTRQGQPPPGQPGIDRADRLLGTCTPADRAQFVTYGLDDADPVQLGSFSGLLSMPFADRTRATYTKVRVPAEHGL